MDKYTLRNKKTGDYAIGTLEEVKAKRLKMGLSKEEFLNIYELRQVQASEPSSAPSRQMQAPVQEPVQPVQQRAQPIAPQAQEVATQPQQATPSYADDLLAQSSSSMPDTLQRTEVARQDEANRQMQMEKNFQTVTEMISGANALEDPMAFRRALDYAEGLQDKTQGEELRDAIMKKWNATGGRDYNIDYLSELNPVPQEKSELTKSLENVFTTEALDQKSILKAFMGSIGAPARVLGYLSGQGEMSDEETLVLRQFIEANAENMQDIIAQNDPSFARTLGTAGLAVGDFALRLLSDPLSWVDFAPLMAKYLKFAGSSVNAEKTLARLLPEATSEEVKRAISLKGSKPTRAEEQAIGKVFSKQEVGVNTGNAKAYNIDPEFTGEIAKYGSGSEKTLATKQLDKMIDVASGAGASIDARKELAFLNEKIPMGTGSNAQLNQVRKPINESIDTINDIRKQLDDAKLELSSAQIDASDAKRLTQIDDLQVRLDKIIEDSNIEELYQQVKSGQASVRTSRKAIAEAQAKINSEKAVLLDELKKLNLDKEKLSITKAKMQSSGDNKAGVNDINEKLLSKREQIYKQKSAPDSDLMAQNKDILNAQKEQLAKNVDEVDNARAEMDLAKSNKKLADFEANLNKAENKMEAMSNTEVSDIKKTIQRLKEQEQGARSSALEAMEANIEKTGRMTLREAKDFVKDMYKHLRDKGFYGKNADNADLKDISNYVSKVVDKIKDAGGKIYGDEFADVWLKHADETRMANEAEDVLKIRKSADPIKAIADDVNEVMKRSGSTINYDDAITKGRLDAIKKIDEIYGTQFIKDMEEAHKTKALFTEKNGKLYFNITKPRDKVDSVIDATKALGGILVNTGKFAIANVINGLDAVTFKKLVNDKRFLEGVVSITKGGGGIRRSLQVQDAIMDMGRKLLDPIADAPRGSTKYEVAKSILHTFAKSLYTAGNVTMSPSEINFLRDNLPNGLGEGIGEDSKINLSKETQKYAKNIMGGAEAVMESMKRMGKRGKDNLLNISKLFEGASMEDIQKASEGFKAVIDYAKDNGVKKTLDNLGVDYENVSDFGQNTIIPLVAKALKDTAFKDYNFTLTSMKREDQQSGEHPNDKAIDIRGLSSDGRSFHPRAKFTRKRVDGKTIYEPNEETQGMIDEIVYNIKKMPFVKKVDFEKENPDTYKSEQWYPHFHIEVDRVGLGDSDVTAVVEALGKALKVKVNRDNFSGDSNVTGVELK